MAEIELLGAWKGKTRKKFAIGVVSHRTLNAETPAEVADGIRTALKYIDIENLVVTSDCGFGRQGANRMVAFYKAAASAQGANIVRREYGLAESYVPCADPGLMQDQVPAVFEDAGGDSAVVRRAFESSSPSATLPSSPSNGGGSRSPSPTQRFSEMRRERR
jgi:hypothetical protein